MAALGRKGPGLHGEQRSSLSRSRCLDSYHLGLLRHRVRIARWFHEGVFISPCAFLLERWDNVNI